MMYGMTYEQYWYGDPWAMKAYRQAYDLRNRRENEMMWINGMYFANALSIVLHNAFSKKGTPPKKYMEKPLDVFPKTEAEIKAERERAQRELIRKLNLWKKHFDLAHEND